MGIKQAKEAGEKLVEDGKVNAAILWEKFKAFVAPLMLKFIVLNRAAIIAHLEAKAAKSDTKLDDYLVKGFDKVLSLIESDGE